MPQIVSAEGPDQSRVQYTLTDAAIYDLCDTRGDISSEDSENSDESLS